MNASKTKIKLVDIQQTGRYMALWQAWELAQASREAQGRVG